MLLRNHISGGVVVLRGTWLLVFYNLLITFDFALDVYIFHSLFSKELKS